MKNRAFGKIHFVSHKSIIQSFQNVTHTRSVPYVVMVNKRCCSGTVMKAWQKQNGNESLIIHL